MDYKLLFSSGVWASGGEEKQRIQDWIKGFTNLGYTLQSVTTFGQHNNQFLIIMSKDLKGQKAN